MSADDVVARGRGAQGDQPAPRRRRPRHRRARRDGDRRRRAGAARRSSPAGAPAPETGGAGRRAGRPVRRALRAHERVPHAPGVQHAPLRDGDAALHAHARVARPLAHALDDPARQLHDEAQRHGGDDPGHLAGVRAAPSVRAGRRRRRATRRCSANLEAALAEITGFARGVAPAERRLAGRVRGAAHHRRVPPVAGRVAPHGVPDPADARTAPTRRAR